jgi:hypothetical protein
MSGQIKKLIDWTNIRHGKDWITVLKEYSFPNLVKALGYSIKYVAALILKITGF